MADENIDMKKEQTASKNKTIQKPVLFNNKAFSACRSFKHISPRHKKSQNSDNIITAEKTLPLLKEEAERETMAKEAINTSYKMAEKQKSKRQRWINFGFLMLNLVILAIILFFQIRSEGAISFSDLISSKMNLWWLLAAVVLFLVINALDSARISISIKQVTGRRQGDSLFKYFI